jgi:antitoxin CptB
MPTMSSPVETIEKKRKRLLYRSKNCGMRELDIFFGQFADKHLRGFSARELDEYERILEAGEPELYRWIAGQEEPPEDYRGKIMDKLLGFCL